ncbi:hypothetical protein L0128_18490 [candidate division KSB1 bacterium]|nr:hypothetical protein [candidate division KSB1 bacterium]
MEFSRNLRGRGEYEHFVRPGSRHDYPNRLPLNSFRREASEFPRRDVPAHLDYLPGNSTIESLWFSNAVTTDSSVNR